MKKFNAILVSILVIYLVKYTLLSRTILNLVNNLFSRINYITNIYLLIFSYFIFYNKYICNINVE